MHVNPTPVHVGPTFDRAPSHIDRRHVDGVVELWSPRRGSHLSTEAEVGQRFVQLFESSEGLALVAASAQSIDRMVSLHRSYERTGRTLIIGLKAPARSSTFPEN
jgi:hypothetical protein